MNHSPEPWHFDEKGHCIDDANHNMILDGTVIVRVRNDRRHESAKPEDLRRIVAAVNACKGLPIQALVSGNIIVYHDLEQRYAQPTHCFAGSLPELNRYAIQLLQDQGYSVVDNHED
jgi:hypothetical protein